MATIPEGPKFHGVDSSIDTADRGSKVTKNWREAYTIGDICDHCEKSVNKLEPVLFVTATPGGTGSLTEMVNIVDFDWSGASGTYTYTLPSATDIPYRKIRFVNNSTVGANNKVALTPQAGETIDGGSTYEINKSYNGCSIWSDGSEWIVIQAKST